MADLKTTQEERAKLRAISADWFADRPDAQGARLLDDLDTLLAEREILRSTMGGLIACNDTLLAENAKLRGEVAEQRVLLRWFLDGDDHTHEDDCGARGSHDLDVCRAAPCLDDCGGPHCACGATEMRARALAALEAP